MILRAGIAALAVLALLPRAGVPASAVPTPESVFGFKPGTDRKLADFSQIVEFYRKLDAASERVNLYEIGKTAEGRTMILAAISSEQNLKALAKHRDVARRLADSRGLTDETARALAREGRAIVWVDFGLHATEVAAAQVSPEIALALATSESEEVRRIRENVITVMVPVMSPDGLDIVAGWYRRNVGTPFETSPLTVLYQKHAGHDNNRDWFMQNLPETRNVTAQLYREWYPQVLYNHHQSGVTSPRIWAPPMDDPVNPNMHPLINRGISLLGVGIMQRLEQEGKRGSQGYSTYSNWWDGGMRSTPCFHNIVGILTEVASGRYATPVELGPEQIPSVEPSTWNASPWRGRTWRLRDQMDYMATATMAVLRLGAEYCEDWLYNRYQMARDQVAAGKRGSPYAYVVPAQAEQHDGLTAAKMIEILQLGDVEIHRSPAALEVEGKKYGPGAYVILMAQPNRGYAKDLLEPQRHPDRREYPGGPPRRPYDMAGWTLPLQMGVRADAIQASLTTGSLVPVPRGARLFEGGPLDRRSNAFITAVVKSLAQGRQVWVTERGLVFDPAGAPGARRAHLPRVALYKSFVASMDEGWTRFVLEQFEVPYTSVGNADVRAGALNRRFDALILPDQSLEQIVNGHAAGTVPPEYAGGIGAEGVAALKSFVASGGTLVAVDGASELPIRHFGIPVRNALEGVRNTVFYCPGSLLRLDVDVSHPLAAGMPVALAGFFVNGRAFDFDAGPSVRPVARYAAKDLLMSGWINGAERIAGRAAALDVALGRGRVLLLGFGPQFRGQPHGTFKFLFNPIVESALER
jgi:hypothetical protein